MPKYLLPGISYQVRMIFSFFAAVAPDGDTRPKPWPEPEPERDGNTCAWMLFLLKVLLIYDTSVGCVYPHPGGDWVFPAAVYTSTDKTSACQ